MQFALSRFYNIYRLMRWKNRRRSDNIIDQRAQRTPTHFRSSGAAGSIIPMLLQLLLRTKSGRKIALVLVGVGIVMYFVGINPLHLLSSQPASYSNNQVAPSSPAALDDPEAAFVGVVLADTETVWNAVFSSQGLDYREPTLVLFRNAVQSACGYANAAVGPFYCARDERIYIDLSFYNQLKREFNAPGDFAQAYVIAHEVGHHVQNLTGVLPQFHQAKARLSDAASNAMSVKVELQADCYAGVWAFYTNQQGLLDQGDLDEALNAAEQIGDDAIQRRVQGYVVPESFNHGTSAQRKAWFNRGYESGEWQQCDTFN